MPLTPSRTKVARLARQRATEIRRSIGQEIVRAREDAGISQRRLAREADFSQGHLSAIEAGEAEAGEEVLARIAVVLGGQLAVRINPGTGPIIRDHLQAAMLQGVLDILHPRWRRFVEVPVYRPVRGVIDLVLDDPSQPITIAAEAHSQLRRLEEQIRRATAKADALQAGGARELASVMRPGADVSRLLLLRVTHATLEVARTYGDLLATAYPARHVDAVGALTGTQPWPGPALIWMDVLKRTATFREAPPRGVTLGR